MFYFILDKNGERLGEFSYGQYNGGKDAAEKKASELGLTVSEERKCPYPGCPNSATARPPCGLCYE